MPIALLATLLGAGQGTPPTTPGTDARRHLLAFVLLERPALPQPDAVVTAFRRIAPGTERDLVAGSVHDDALEFVVGSSGSLMVGLMPFPVPRGEADEAFDFSVSSLRGTTKLAPHRAHLVAFFGDRVGTSRKESLTRFTYLIAALAEASGAAAVYWGAAGATHDTKYLVEVAREHDPDLMLSLWTGISIASDGPARVSLLSLGMQQQLGIMELRLTAPRKDLARAIGFFFDALAYAAKRGTAVPEGDTLGSTAEQRLKVWYESSPLNPNERVWRIDLP
jgi:hypothetical protein